MTGNLLADKSFDLQVGENIRKEQLEEIEELDCLFQAICPMIREYELQNARPDEVKVVEFLSPSELQDVLQLSVTDEGSVERFLASCRDLLKYSVRTRHPRFMNQLYAGSTPSGQIAELLTAVLNSTVHTYAAGPVFAVVERSMITRVAELLGHEDPPSCDGVFAPGGSHANLSALMAARSAVFPHVLAEGWRPDDRPVVFVSSHAHYSIRQAPPAIPDEAAAAAATQNLY
jgi:glutamate/tyrosine decarboxylase-like PLP-dependent enzyme